MTRVKFVVAVASLFLLLTDARAEPRRVTLHEIAGAAPGAAATPADAIEIRGVAAGPFDPALWEAGKLHLLPDLRSPLLEPREGRFRNIYAPSVVQTEAGWDIYYGAWDGVATGNDRIYRVSTSDFLAFGERRTIIEHGAFQHVCNVSADRLPDGSHAMLCTTYPDERGLNKPAFFTSSDGRRWNGSPGPHAARRDDVVAIEGYDGYAGADINGMNVLLHEDGLFRMYFGNFRDFGKVYRATSRDGRRYALDGVALAQHAAVNDVKKFRLDDGSCRYLMGLHLNGDQLWYALSRDGRSFGASRVLARNLGDADRYIVSVGFVVEGGQEEAGRRRVLGFLYGAGAKPTLDANRIFARWLQRRVVFRSGNQSFAPFAALGPDRQLVKRPSAANLTVEVYAEDGATLLGRGEATSLKPGRAYLAVVE